MKTPCMIAVTLVLAASSVLLAAPKRKIPPQARLARTARPEMLAAAEKAAQKPHPRLFADASTFEALKARAAKPGLTQDAAAWIRVCADQLLTTKPFERKLEGRRLLGVSRQVAYRMTTLGMAYRLFGEKAYLERAVAEMRTVAGFKDWNPSHFLDVAEMTLALSVGYDWLYNDLDEETRKTVSSAIRRLGLEAARPFAWWNVANNNWGQVCHAGILAGTLALAEENPAEAACYIQRAVDCLPFSMKALAPNGNYPEGPGYWSYGVEFNIVAIALMDAAFGTNFGLADQPGFKETAFYPDFVTGPSGLTFNYADGGSGRGCSFSTWWFARKFNRPDLLAYFENDFFRKRIAKKVINTRKIGNRLLPLALFYLEDLPAGSVPRAPLVWDAQGPTPITIQRSTWDNTHALFVGLKGGTPSANHGHMDGGSFVIESQGIRWGLDLGAENYNKIEQLGMKLWGMGQTSDRWKIYRLGTLSHNVLMLDHCPQLVKGFAKVMSVTQGKGCGSQVTLDLTTLYTNATSVVRCGKMSADGKTYTLTDAVRGLRPGAPVRWAMMTDSKATIDGATVRLKKDKKTFTVTQDGTNTAPWSVIPAKGPNTWDSDNKNCRQLIFTVPASADGSVDLSVRFE